jgi:uncharacterized protein (TIGR03663 family)
MPALDRLHLFLLGCILAFALVLRLAQLDARPMHADEANQAVKLGQLLTGEGYGFDPRDHHGPTLYYFAAVTAWLRGESTLPALTETTVRLTPALCGALSVFLLWLLARPLGRWPALTAALFYALSPPAVYYSRYFIQETLLVTFLLATWLCAGRASAAKTRSPETLLLWLALTGLGVGLLLATKAIAPLLLFFTFIAFAIAARTCRENTAPGSADTLVGLPLRQSFRTARVLRLFVTTAVIAVGVAALFYSSFGRNPRGLLDALGTFAPMFERGVGGATGHEKPWWYYARLFLRFREGGYTWDQTPFTLVALAGAGLAWRTPAHLPRFAALFTALLALALSFAPYKTPWQVVSLVPGLCLLAANALAALGAFARFRFVALALALLVAFSLARQTRLAAFLRPADQRNPYAYAHTSPDLKKIAALAAAAPDGPIKVIAPEYWPLPWYLRARAEVGYWSGPPDDCDAALVITDLAQADFVRARLRSRYRETFLGLRPGVLLVVFQQVTHAGAETLPAP